MKNNGKWLIKKIIVKDSKKNKTYVKYVYKNSFVEFFFVRFIPRFMKFWIVTVFGLFLTSILLIFLESKSLIRPGQSLISVTNIFKSENDRSVINLAIYISSFGMILSVIPIEYFLSKLSDGDSRFINIIFKMCVALLIISWGIKEAVNTEIFSNSKQLLYFLLFLLVSCSYFIWICSDMIKVLYIWTHDDANNSKEINMVKLAFIWGVAWPIISLILGVLL